MKLNPIKHGDGATDYRYQVRTEYTGAPRLQYVARFCGDWVGSADTYTGAAQLAADHQTQRITILEGAAA